MRYCLKLLMVLLTIFFIASMPHAYTVEAEMTRHTVRVNGHKREYAMYVPEHPGPTARPLVLAFHGYRGTPKDMAALSGLNALAQQENFYVAYPIGRQKTWNVGAIPGNAEDEDVLLTDAVIQQIQQQYPINSNRIYALGMSNGGFFAIRLACQRPGTIAAAGAVAATMAKPLLTTHCPNTPHPVPVAFINGTDDPVVLWEGGLGRLKTTFPDSELASAKDTLAFWADRHECSTSPQVVPISQTHQGNAPYVTHITYLCTDLPLEKSPVQQWVVHHGGHTWPGSPTSGSLKQHIYRLFAGKTTQELDATRVMWQFFQNHPLTKSP